MLLKDNLESLQVWAWYILEDKNRGLKVYAMANRNYTTDPISMDFISINATGILSIMSARDFITYYPETTITKVRNIRIEIKSDFAEEDQKRTYICDLNRK